MFLVGQRRQRPDPSNFRLHNGPRLGLGNGPQRQVAAARIALGPHLGAPGAGQDKGPARINDELVDISFRTINKNNDCDDNINWAPSLHLRRDEEKEEEGEEPEAGSSSGSLDLSRDRLPFKSTPIDRRPPEATLSAAIRTAEHRRLWRWARGGV